MLISEWCPSVQYPRGSRRWSRFMTFLKSFQRLGNVHTLTQKEPLRILFCGSDDFSIASLQKLHNLHQSQEDIVASIDVVCRPGKRVGRGLKTIRHGTASNARNHSSLFKAFQYPFLTQQKDFPYLCMRLILSPNGRCARGIIAVLSDFH